MKVRNIIPDMSQIHHGYLSDAGRLVCDSRKNTMISG